jgi:hypothetical protein
MTVGWVASVTRGRSLARRLVGHDTALSLATGSWLDARDALSETFYGAHCPPNPDRATLARCAVEATAWQMRVLAGWMPAGQGVLARLFAAPLEIANIEGRLARIGGLESLPPLHLGSLGVAWPQVADARTSSQVRDALARSVWGDPGGIDPGTIGLSLRIVWSRRLASRVPEAAAWAKGAAAVLVAREQFCFERSVSESATRIVDELLGRHWHGATTLPAFVQSLPKPAVWPLVAVQSTADLWMSEVAVARRVDADARRYVDSSRYSQASITGVMALLLVDLWRVRSAIDLAGRGPAVQDVLDAVA